MLQAGNVPKKVAERFTRRRPRKSRSGVLFFTEPTKAGLLKVVARPERGAQSVQGRIGHKRYPSRRAGPCHLFRSSLESIAPHAEKVTRLWRLIAPVARSSHRR